MRTSNLEFIIFGNTVSIENKDMESSIPYSVDIVNFAMLDHEELADHIKGRSDFL